MAAQHLRGDAVEGAEPLHALDRVADHPPDALAHLARRLVGEGDGEDFGWPRAARRDDVREARGQRRGLAGRSEEHTSELQSLMRISYAVFCLKKKTKRKPRYCR